LLRPVRVTAPELHRPRVSGRARSLRTSAIGPRATIAADARTPDAGPGGIAARGRGIGGRGHRPAPGRPPPAPFRAPPFGPGRPAPLVGSAAGAARPLLLRTRGQGGRAPGAGLRRPRRPRARGRDGVPPRQADRARGGAALAGGGRAQAPPRGRDPARAG